MAYKKQCLKCGKEIRINRPENEGNIMRTHAQVKCKAKANCTGKKG